MSNRSLDKEETQRRGRLVLQTLPIFLIPIFVTLATFVFLRFVLGQDIRAPVDDPGPRPNPLVPLIVVVVFFSALIILVRLGRPTISALLIIGVWTLATASGALRAGVTSYLPALLLIPICAAGLLIDRIACISLAGLATVLVCSLAWSEYQGLIVATPAVSNGEPFNNVAVAAAFWVTLIISIAALTSLLAEGLQRALAQSRARAEALQELSSQLEARVEAQTDQILDQERDAATLAERTRLAREIHDTLAQGLTSIVVQLGAAQRAMTVDAAAAEQHIELAQRMARESLSEARRSVWNLRAPALERAGLADALRSIVARQSHQQMSAIFEQRGDPWPLTAEAEAALLRATQEALANVAKHAQASQIMALLEYLPDRAELVVTDNGIGFDEGSLASTTVPGAAGGFGLVGMRERLAGLGGTLTLQNVEAGGAQVHVTVPRPPIEGA